MSQGYSVPQRGRGGTRLYTNRTFPALLKAYYNLGINASNDGKAHQILSFAWGGDQVGPLGVVELEYADKVDDAPVLAEYNSIKQEAIQDNTKFSSLVELARTLGESAAAPGLRQQFWTWTTKLDLEQATITKDIFLEELGKLTNASAISPALSLQVLSQPIINKTTQNGGNPLGLDPKDGPLMLGLIAFRWSDSKLDQMVHNFADTVMKRCLAAAKAAGKSTDYLYMNYASPWQDVVASYGANKAKLQNISRKYDPSAVFQRLQPGYFKLNGPPV